MHGGGFGQMVPDIDAHAITLFEMQPGYRDPAVECISVHRDARQDRPPNNRRIEFEHLESILDVGSASSRFPRASRPYAFTTSRGFTAAMSIIASAGVSRSMIMPGGIIAPPTSRAERRRFSQFAGATIPSASASTETPATAAS
jgi:hypothetical protein